jgi:transcription-repair coupling factor (superfamily II helicase)
MSSEKFKPPTENYNFLVEEVQNRIGPLTLLDGLGQSGAALAFSCLASDHTRTYLWVCTNNREAETIATNLEFFSSGRASVVLIPGFEADPYRGLSPHPAIINTRTKGLVNLLYREADFVVTTWHSLISRLPSPVEFRSSLRTIEMEQPQPMEDLLKFLDATGYAREDFVSEVGEYSCRGGIVDFFSPAQKHPVRLEFFGDEIESIRHFDPANQQSIELLTQCRVDPLRELLTVDQDLGKWHRKAPEYWNEIRFSEALKEKLQFTEHLELFNGFEYLLPLVWGHKSSILDYIQSERDRKVHLILASPENIKARTQNLWRDLHSRYKDCTEAGELALPPDNLFFNPTEILETYKNRCSQSYYHHDFIEKGPERCHFDFLPTANYRGQIQRLLRDLQEWSRRKHRVIFVTRTPGKSQRLAEILQDYDVDAAQTKKFSESLEHPVNITCGNLDRGFSSDRQKLHLLTEEGIFGESLPRLQKSVQRDAAAVFRSDFTDLRDGDLVVHVTHGIGSFRGLKRIKVNETEKEFVELAYRNEAKLFVPIDCLDLLQKYNSAGESRPRLDQLGGTGWDRTKKRIRKSLVELAAGLIKLYAKREIIQGHAFAEDDALIQEFEAAFEHEETPDQLTAINAVKQDMESTRPMDRLICGDVGYGKTEVALRAVFKAVNDNFQVALLAPTTILAYQHLNTFRQRFAGFPVKVEMLSRFRTAREQKKILEHNRTGRIDVLIGTHRLLSDDVKFHNLGLLIVDEEQRFGVAQKEKVKRFKTQVDVLTLSATPIPRTLNMSILGVRDLSIIETPPKDRLAIQTVVVRFSENIIRSAIDLELKRHGQTFFVHNSVETIYTIAELVQRIVPEARVGVAHGQLPELELEEVMLKFLNHESDVLVCTTIIENGLDISRANTLLVNRADHFGLSQLYQLRGRVGRSGRRAYAYFLIPPRETLTTVAQKRLAAIREFSDLGAGFHIAGHDLAIRGAGNLLGAQQHGHINAVGFDLYTKLLKETVSELRGEEIMKEISPNLELGMHIQIPDHYISNERQRLWLYKRISSLHDENALASLKAELIDRYGKYPRAVSNLLDYGHLQVLCKRLRILTIERKQDSLLTHFNQDSPVQPQALMSLLTAQPKMAISPSGVLTIPLPHNSPKAIFGILFDILETLSVIQ